MLNEVYRHAMENRERLVGSLGNYGDIVDEARRRWVCHEAPRKEHPETLGVDGSCNRVSYQGMELWVSTAVAASADGRTVVGMEPRMGIGRNTKLHDTMRHMEADACAKASDMAEIVLMDGSLRTVFIADDERARDELLRLLRGNETRIIFVSKTSEVDFEFGDMGAMAGDIYYYGLASSEPGFSDILVKEAPRTSMSISSTYARLAHSTPLMKVEMLGDGIDEGDVRGLLEQLGAQCAGGYPQALRQAHNECTITNDTMDTIAAIFGINAVGSRAILQ